MASMIGMKRRIVDGIFRLGVGTTRMCRFSFSSAPPVLEYLESLRNYEREGVPSGAGTNSSRGFDLSRMRRLLSSLDDPHLLYPVVHVAGTKGKGSTVSFISNILRAGGYSVGSYTSPHIWSICERIIVGKKEEAVSISSFQKLFEGVWDRLEDVIAAEGGALTHFEVLTALAFKHFAEEHVDIAIVEAGLGGARDATNVIPPSGLALAVITNIGKEHLKALGGSIETIALAKAGIIKEGRPVVLGGPPMDPKLQEIIDQVAKANHAKVIPAFGDAVKSLVKEVHTDEENAFQHCDIQVTILDKATQTMEISLSDVRLQMLGHHQLNNAITATCVALCLQSQGWKIHASGIKKGLERTKIPGRFQIISKDSFNIFGCNNSYLVFDGAHTSSSASALAETLKSTFVDIPLAIVVAMASDKDHFAFAKELLQGYKSAVRKLLTLWERSKHLEHYQNVPGARPTVVAATEVRVGGDTLRSFAANSLAEVWLKAAKELNMKTLHLRKKDDVNMVFESGPEKFLVVVEDADAQRALEWARKLLNIHDQRRGVLCITGSLHFMSSLSQDMDAPQIGKS